MSSWRRVERVGEVAVGGCRASEVVFCAIDIFMGWRNDDVFDIYETAKDNSWRFLLGKSGKNMLIVVGLNPSTATDTRPDMTLRKIERIASDNGYDGFVVVNLCPLRSTIIEDLPVEPDAEAHRKNLEVVEAFVRSLQRPCLWAAWSGGIRAREYLQHARDDLIARLKPYRFRWLRYGPLTKSGHPRHPSRVPYGLVFEPFTL